MTTNWSLFTQGLTVKTYNHAPKIVLKPQKPIPIFLLDECKNNNGGCSHFCRDLDEGFICECPAELELSDDGLSCVSVCYSCENAADLSDCQETERCDSSATPCVTKVAGGLISKGCESTERCIKDGSLGSATCLQKNRVRDRFSGSVSRQATGQIISDRKAEQVLKTETGI